jgi:hypothetical protein
MKSFSQWLSESEAGQVTGNYQNDEIMQTMVGSKYLARVNTNVKVPKTADCMFLGICPKGPRKRVNLEPVEI